MPRISFFSRIIDMIAPRQCAICGQRLTISEQAICGVCNMRLPRTDYFLSPHDNEVARLLWGQIPVEHCASWFHYAPGSEVAHMIHNAKYYQHPELCETLGELLATEVKDTGFFNGIDLLVPVPLTARRRRQRGYNQSECIARGIGNTTHLPVESRAVKRLFFGGSQTGKDRFQRRENVEEAFSLVRPDLIAGRHLLVIDDILTTGATVTSCARELLKTPDVKISVLTLGMTKS